MTGLSFLLQWLPVMLVILLCHIFSHWPSVVLWPTNTAPACQPSNFLQLYRLPIMRLSWLRFIYDKSTRETTTRKSFTSAGCQRNPSEARSNLFWDLFCCLHNKNWLCFMTNLRSKESLSTNNNVDASFETIFLVLSLN